MDSSEVDKCLSSWGDPEGKGSWSAPGNLYADVAIASGCSTLLKTISGETGGFYVDAKTSINYQGIPMTTMHKDFRGECIYQAEVDVHFPQLTVGQTLEFAARARGKPGECQTLHGLYLKLSSTTKPNSRCQQGAIR
jgi:ABC-type branched-subunit amino acid transport system ATPase component